MRVLVTGASGQLGAYLIPALLESGHDVFAWSGTGAGQRVGVPLRPIDLTDLVEIPQRLDAESPEAIIHLAAISTAAGVLQNLVVAQNVNFWSTAVIADWCHRNDRRMIFASTDLVFSGSNSWNREDDPAEPVLAYGRTKRQAESAVLETPRALVSRLPLMYGPTRCERPGFFDLAMDAARRGEPRAYFEDEFRTPLDYGTAACILVLLLESEAAGIVHVAGAERVSRFELMRRVVSASGLDPSSILANRRSDAPGPEPRPGDVSLDTSRLTGLIANLRRPSIEEAVSTWTRRVGLG